MNKEHNKIKDKGHNKAKGRAGHEQVRGMNRVATMNYFFGASFHPSKLAGRSGRLLLLPGRAGLRYKGCDCGCDDGDDDMVGRLGLTYG